MVRQGSVLRLFLGSELIYNNQMNHIYIYMYMYMYMY